MRTRVLTVIFLVLLCCTGCTKMMFRSAERVFQKGMEGKPYDVVIVPGFPYNGQNWNRVLKMRIHWAKFLFEGGYTKNIIFSGSAVATPYVESKVMAAYARALGIPESHLFIEDRAEHSTENVYFSYNLAHDLGFSKIALATDPFQTSYMRKFVGNFALKMDFLPTVLDTLRSLNMPEPAIELQNTMQPGFVKLSDRENFFQRFKGTLGQNIVWHERHIKKKKHFRKYKNRIIPSSALSREP